MIDKNYEQKNTKRRKGQDMKKTNKTKTIDAYQNPMVIEQAYHR